MVPRVVRCSRATDQVDTESNMQQPIVVSQATGNTASTVYQPLHYAPLQGIGSGHRQLITGTCIAEHA